MPYKDPAKAKAHRAAYYAANADRERELARNYARQRGRIWRAGARAVIDEAKGTACWDCGGEFEPTKLHFHHRDPSTKLFNIANYTTLRGRQNHDALRAEIAKCDVLCVGCHAARHRPR